MVFISFSVEGEVQISRKLLGLASTIQDFTPALEKSSEDLLEIISYDVFESEGAAIDEPWAQLSPGYAKWKERKYPGNGILVRTGLMQDSFSSIVDTSSLKIWNAVEYFKYHQSKGERSSNLPRRVMLRLTENMKQMVVKNFQTMISESLQTQSLA